MTPDFLRRLRNHLDGAVDRLRAGGFGHYADDAAEILAALPPDPGGAMPEPDAGMRVTMADGCRTTIEQAAPSRHDSAAWVVWVRGGLLQLWTPDAIREIRTPDGRVLWRAKED